MVVFLVIKALENFLSYDLTGNGTRKQACRYVLTEDAPVVDREEAYCYNERNKLPVSMFRRTQNGGEG